MLAILYLAGMIYFGDCICRYFFRFNSIQHRFATSFLVGLLLSSCISYLGSLAFAFTAQPLIMGNIIFLGVLILVALKMPRRRSSGYLDSVSLRPPGNGKWDWLCLGVLFIFGCWLMLATLGFQDGNFQFGYKSWSDFGANLSLSQSFTLGHNFPTEHPYVPGELARYHFLFWFQAANLSFLGLNLASAVNLLSILSLMALLVLIMTFAELLFESRVVARISAILFFFASSSLSYIPFLSSQPDVSGAISSIWNKTQFLVSGYPFRGEDWGALSVDVFANQRHLISGVGILFVVMVFLVDFYRHKKSLIPIEPPLIEKDEIPPTNFESSSIIENETSTADFESASTEDGEILADNEIEDGETLSENDIQEDEILSENDIKDSETLPENETEDDEIPPVNLESTSTENEEISLANLESASTEDLESASIKDGGISTANLESFSTEEDEILLDDETEEEEILRENDIEDGEILSEDDEDEILSENDIEESDEIEEDEILTGNNNGEIQPQKNKRSFRLPEDFWVDIQTLLFCGVLIGAMPYWNSAIFVSALIVLGSIFLFFPYRLYTASLIGTAVLVGLPQVLMLRSGSLGQSGYSIFDWGYTIPEPTVLLLFQYLGWTFGFKLLLIFIALWLLPNAHRLFFLAVSSLILVVFLLRLSVDPFNNHKLINIWGIFGSVYAAYALWRIGRESVSRTALATLLALAMVFGAIIDLFPIHNDPPMSVYHENDRLTTWLFENTKPSDVFLTYPFLSHPILFTGRKIFLGHTLFAWAAGYNVGAREAIYKQMYQESNPEELIRLLRANNISYVGFDEAVRGFGMVKENLNEALYQQNFEKVFEDTEKRHANLTIYKVPVGDSAIVPGG